MDWQDYVRTKDRKRFYTEEARYTKSESFDFDEATGWKEKESARARVLAKRLEFLALWIEKED